MRQKYRELLENIFADNLKAHSGFVGDEGSVGSVLAAAQAIIGCYEKGGKVLIFGNGGSAADAMHMAAELVVRFESERKALPCIALSADQATLTAISNDYDFSRSFSRQVEAFAAPGDVVIAISTSGNSPNVLAAVSEAKKRNAIIVSIGGRDGGKLSSLADFPIVVKDSNTGRIQEVHSTIIHAICKMIEVSLQNE